MRTNIEINDALISSVMKDGKFASKRAAVEAALNALRMHYAAQKIRAMRGKVQWDGDLNAWRTAKVRP